MRILLAPDKFKGTLDAPSVAAAMAKGVRDALPAANPIPLPLADGGEGTLDCVARATGGEFATVEAEDAFGTPTTARVYDAGTAAMLALHETAGLPARPTRVTSLRASTRGAGLALVAARSLFPDRELVVWLGGSASTDGGAGAARAAGWRLLDARGRDLPAGGGALRSLARIEPPAHPFPGPVKGACDVDNPLLGAEGAARAFAPQKGAGLDEVRILEEGLATLAERLRADAGVDVASISRGGAAGGAGAGLVAFFGATLEDGFARVASETRLHDEIAAADVVVTGEGRVDASTLRGKVVASVARACAAAGKPCLVVAGEVGLPAEMLPAAAALGATVVVSLVDSCGRRAAFDETARCVRDGAAAALSSFAAGNR